MSPAEGVLTASKGRRAYKCAGANHTAAADDEVRATCGWNGSVSLPEWLIPETFVKDACTYRSLFPSSLPGWE